MKRKLRKRRCPVCKNQYVPFNSLQKCCSNYKCAIEQGKIDTNARERRELRAAKEAIKPKAKWMKEAQFSFNRFIRERDKGLPCISCQRHHQGQYHAGHYRPSKNSAVRFDVKNVHLQCAPCNTHLSGNLTEYRKHLIIKIGLDEVELLEGEKSNEIIHWTIEELKEIKRLYNSKYRSLVQFREKHG